MVIKPIKPLSEWHVNKIHKDVIMIRSINNPDLYTKKLIALNARCLMCSQILNQLAKNCIQAAKCLDIAILEEHNKNRRVHHSQVFGKKTAYFNRKIVWGLGIVIKTLLFLLIPPLTLLFWVKKDPYKQFFCRNHFGFRPIKKEQIRRWIIYFIWSIIWLAALILLFLYFMNLLI